MYDKIVVITRKTRLDELVERFNTRGQAKFYIEHGGGDFTEYEREHDAYRRSLDVLRRELDLGLKVLWLDRDLIPTVVFALEDLIVTLGQDGLVANAAKYVRGQPIVAVNPDPARFDGILLPFLPGQASRAVQSLLEGRARHRTVTMAEARLNDGQRMLGFNDLFIGARTHISARYRISWQLRSEAHSSSGIIVSTGAGSTGWASSVFNMVSGIAAFTGGSAGRAVRMDFEDPRLLFLVREPFVSRHSSAAIVAGILEEGRILSIDSLMPSYGVIFSDGIESDYLQFNAGATASVGPAVDKADLVIA